MAWSLIPATSYALHRETGGAVRVGPAAHSRGRSWANYLAFSSDRNLTDPTSVGRQIYVYHHFNWVCQRGFPEPPTAAMCPNPPVPFLVRVTNGPGAPDNPSVSDAIDVDGDGEVDTQWVAYDADGGHNGGTGCEASRRQIFLKEIYSQELRQITFACDGDSTNPTLSFHGGLLAFQSTGNIVGPPAPAGVPQIYTYFKNDLVLRRITAGGAPSINPMINKVGTKVAFQSQADLLGTNADTGIFQIFWADYDRQRHTSVIHQLTNGNGSSENPYIAEDAPIMAFDSTATDLPGAVSPSGRQIYVARTDTLPSPDLPPVTQLTTEANLGNCSFPTIDPSNNRVGFICSSDPPSSPTVRNRAYSFDLDSGQLFSVSAADDIQGPVSQSMGQWFMTLATSFDLIGQASCGSQLHVVDFFAGPTDGNSIIGNRKFAFVTGDLVGASQGELTTRDGTLVGRLLEHGSIDMNFAAPDQFTGETNVSVPPGFVKLPPVPLNGVGAFCIEQTGAGSGILDCDGGAAGPDVAAWQDHMTDDVDPLCLVGCREDDPVCNGGILPGPHRVECPICTQLLRCSGGPYAGAVCSTDANCRVGMEFCEDDPDDYPMCNGPLTTEFTGEFSAGGLRLSIPMRVRLSTQVGDDDKFCTGDDPYDPYFGARTVSPLLRLTTGVATSRVVDTDAIPGTLLGKADQGGALECSRLRAGDLDGAVLVAALPLVDVHIPNSPFFFRDAIVELRLEAKPGTVDACSFACTVDTDCNDLNACNGVETCAGGFCTGGTPVVCDDLNACNGEETCVPSTGACLTAAPPLCDDGNPCNGAETCDALQGCVPGTAVECNDGNPCNGLESCNPLTGQCRPGVALCDDLDPCNGTETCDRLTATCFPGNPIVCDDHNPCNGVESCDPNTAACETTTAPLCDDDNPCNGVEICNPQTGACSPGTVPDCDDGNTCTIDSCDTTHGCHYEPKCDDGNACNGVETCEIATGNCLPGVPFSCDDGDICTIDSCDINLGCLHGPACGDGNFCNGVEVCDPGTGACGAGVPLTCDDANSCTNDSCDPATGCVTTFNTNPCDDLDLCTTDDACHLGECTGTELICTDGDACNGLELCEPASGTCLPGTPLECDDGNVCTDDTCDQIRGCIETNNDLPCDDGSLCTTADQCQGGLCTGDPACDDGLACNGTETCDPGSGACGPGTALVCDDGNICTDDSCDDAFGCRTTNNTAPCDDGSLCVTGEVCSNGACVGTSVGCDDGDACNGTETCDTGTGGCLSGVVPTCDDSILCTVDLCDPVEGCTNTPADSGAEGILCMLEALEAAVNSPPALAYRRANLQNKLLRLVGNGKRKMQKVLAGVNRPRPLLSQTHRLLRRFIVRVRIAEKKLFIERAYGDKLMGMAAAPMPLISDLAHGTMSPVVSADVAAADRDELRGSLEQSAPCDEK